MAPSGISIRKSSAPSLPTSMAGVYEEKPLRGSSRRGARMMVCGSHQAAACAAVVFTSLVWVVLLHVTGVRDWVILGGREEPLLQGTENVKHGVKHGGYGLSYIASSQNDGVGSGLVELVDGEGKRSEMVRPQELAFVGINTGFDSAIQGQEGRS